jgi:hypothetical protein
MTYKCARQLCPNLVALLHCGKIIDPKNAPDHRNTTGISTFADMQKILAGRSPLRLAMFATYAP